MPLIKCQKCGEQYDRMYAISHCCKIEEERRLAIKQEEYKKAAKLKRFFLYHPNTPFVIKVISFLIFFRGLLYLLTGFPSLFYSPFSGISELFFLPELQEWERAQTTIGSIFVLAGVISLILSYGLAHLKKWSIYLYFFLVVGSFVSMIILQKEIVINLIFGPIGFIVVLLFYKEFQTATHKTRDT